jgi:hypothetical protein
MRMIRRLVKLIIAVSVVANIVFFASFACYITGYSSFAELIQAIWIYLENAFEYYLGIPLPYADYLVKSIALVGIFLIVAIALYVVDKIF